MVVGHRGVLGGEAAEWVRRLDDPLVRQVIYAIVESELGDCVRPVEGPPSSARKVGWRRGVRVSEVRAFEREELAGEAQHYRILYTRLSGQMRRVEPHLPEATWLAYRVVTPWEWARLAVRVGGGSAR